ncbi:hypothetical protein GCM10027418_25030 [Mariniluteicoccus endophyticus]
MLVSGDLLVSAALPASVVFGAGVFEVSGAFAEFEAFTVLGPVCGGAAEGAPGRGAAGVVAAPVSAAAAEAAPAVRDGAAVDFPGWVEVD